MEFEEIFSKIDYGSCQEQTAERFKSYIEEIGTAFINDDKFDTESRPHQVIINLLNLHRNMLKIVKSQFNEKQLYHRALRDAFIEIMNKEYYISALLARLANDLLKKGSTINITNIEDTMDQIVMLYGFVRDKGKLISL